MIIVLNFQNNQFFDWNRSHKLVRYRHARCCLIAVDKYEYDVFFLSKTMASAERRAKKNRNEIGLWPLVSVVLRRNLHVRVYLCAMCGTQPSVLMLLY